MVRPPGDAKVTKVWERRRHTITRAAGTLVTQGQTVKPSGVALGALGCPFQREPGALLILALFLSGRFRLALFCAAASPNQKGDCPSLAHNQI